MTQKIIDKHLQLLLQGVDELISEQDLRQKLEQSISTKRPLKIKLGCDPTHSDLHLGHAVILQKLRQFQELGHIAILIIGDFTASIGDPSGRNKTRPMCSAEDIERYAQTYFQQVFKILDKKHTQVLYNKSWLGKLSFTDIINLSSKLTVAQILQRDDFQNRYVNHQTISLHELLYPLAQGYDSVHIGCDVELGGVDQKFNLLVGRDLQRKFNQEPQVCMTLPLLVGIDGVKKMSKTYGNAIGLLESKEDMYGKLLSIPDDMILSYYELLTPQTPNTLLTLKKHIEENPRNSKHDMAFQITQLYHGKDGAIQAQKHFEKTIINKEIPKDIPIYDIKAGVSVKLVDIITDKKWLASRSEAKRLIAQGGIQIDNHKIVNIDHCLMIEKGKTNIVKVGRRNYYMLRGS